MWKCAQNAAKWEHYCLTALEQNPAGGLHGGIFPRAGSPAVPGLGAVAGPKVQTSEPFPHVKLVSPNAQMPY